MSAILITPYDPADAAGLVPMWHASFEHGVGITDTRSVAERRAYFDREVVPPHNAVWVARRGGLIVGFIAATPESVMQLFVRIGWLRRGIGRRLLDIAKRDSTGRLWLYAFVQNSNACDFYRSQGFVEAGRESQNMYRLEAIRFEWRRLDGALTPAGDAAAKQA